jgi:hypothetical protein
MFERHVFLAYYKKVYIISNWLEKGVFPCIEQGHIQALTVVLTTKPCTSDEQPLGHHSLIELFRFQMERVDEEADPSTVSRSTTKAGMRCALEELQETLTTDFDDTCCYELEKVYLSFVLEYNASAPRLLQPEWFSASSSSNPLTMLESDDPLESPTLHLAQSTPNLSNDIVDTSTEKEYVELASWRSERDGMILMHQRHVSNQNVSVEQILNPTLANPPKRRANKKRERTMQSLSPKGSKETFKSLTKLLFDDDEDSTTLPQNKSKDMDSKTPTKKRSKNSKTTPKYRSKDMNSKTTPKNRDKDSKTTPKNKDKKKCMRSSSLLRFRPLSFITPKSKSPFYYSVASEVATLLVSADSCSSLSL